MLGGRPARQQETPDEKKVMNDNIACAAHRYAERGWPVLPLEPQNKKPLGRLVRRGLHDATVDHKLIDRWWHEEPYANVGLRTGVRFDALDCDGEEALAAFPHDLAPGEPPILGPTVVTGRELGLHCYVPPSGLGSRKPAPGLDYKGRNGYVVAPPSVHPSGAVYRWYDGEDDPYRGVDAPIQPAPAWLLALLYPPADTRVVDRAKPSRGGFGSGRRKRYGRRALEHEITRVATTQEGERNIALNRAAFRLGQLVPNGAIDVDSAIEALVLVAEMIGLPAVEAEGTIASGFRAGAHNPSWS
jgi:hypothetical protein